MLTLQQKITAIYTQQVELQQSANENKLKLEEEGAALDQEVIALSANILNAEQNAQNIALEKAKRNQELLASSVGLLVKENETLVAQSQQCNTKLQELTHKRNELVNANKELLNEVQEADKLCRREEKTLSKREKAYEIKSKEMAEKRTVTTELARRIENTQAQLTAMSAQLHQPTDQFVTDAQYEQNTISPMKGFDKVYHDSSSSVLFEQAGEKRKLSEFVFTFQAGK